MGFGAIPGNSRRRWPGRLALVPAALLLTQLVTAQADARWFGTWVYRPARSLNAGDALYKKGTLEIAPSGDSVKITYDLFRDRGGVIHLEWTGRFDGRDYPLQGVDEYSVTNAYRQLDDRTYEIVQRVDGAISSTATIALSTDGKTLTTVTPGKNALGESVTTTTVYEKR